MLSIYRQRACDSFDRPGPPGRGVYITGQREDKCFSEGVLWPWRLSLGPERGHPVKTFRALVTVTTMAVAAVLLTAPPASAADTVVSASAVADTYTASSSPSTNYGTSASLAAYSTPGITSLLRFTIPATPAGQTLTGAVLRLSTTNITSAGSANPANVRTAADTWSEASTIYTNRPAVSGPVLGTLPGGTAPNTRYAVTLTPAALAAGSITLAIEGTGTDSLWLWSRQAPATATRPVLDLTYTDDTAPPPDTTAPGAPAALAASVTGTTVALSWQASTDNVGVTGYTVHRSSTANFTPTAATVIATVPGTSFSDTDRPAGTWHYRVTAGDAAGNTSAPSSPASATVSPPAQPTTASVAAVADTYTASSSPSTNYGTSASLAAYSTPGITSLLRFTIPATPAGQTLTGAVLRLSTTNITSAGSANPATIRTAADTWSEAATTYTNRPAVSGPVLGTLPGGTAPNTRYAVTLTPSALAAGSITLAIEGTGTDSLWLWSRQAPATATRPVLDLTYTGGTPPPPPETATIMAVGDIACQSGTAITSTACRHGEVASLIRAANPDRFIGLGDLQYQQATYAQFMASGAYNDTFGPLKPITLPVLGNHEYLDSTNGYFDYFYGSGVSSGPLGSRPNGYYSTQIGSWTFIGLNTECGTGGVTGGCGVGSPQYTWLQDQLASSSSCTVVATHRPRWSTGASHGSYPQMSALWDLMAVNGVDITISGHNHVSEIFKPIGVSGSGSTPAMDANGIRAFTAGGGGANIQGLTPTTDPLISALEARSRVAFGPLELVLGDGEYSWRFIPISGMTFTNSGTTGSFSGSDDCH
ncbi:hypothetical protein GCM10008097_13860 [Mycetocola manganoxydans]|nr:hypothetical protein GCM10008097_13860 [Mycetocola manganoxydans]